MFNLILQLQLESSILSKLEIEFHLQRLKQEFECYFSDLNHAELLVWKMTRNPFSTTEDILLYNLQKEFLEMTCKQGVEPFQITVRVQV